MSPEDSYTGLEKEVTDAFYAEWGTELDDVNYLDGIIFTIEYLRKNGMLNEGKYSSRNKKAVKYAQDVVKDLKKKKEEPFYFPDYHM